MRIPFVAALLTSLLLASSMRAQLPPLPSQSYYSIGKVDWTMPCGPYAVETQLTSTPWDRVIDPNYPGPTTSYSCRLGGIFYLRAMQRDAMCQGYLPLGTTIPPVFLFGPRATSSIVAINLPFFYPGQNYVFSGLTVAYSPTHAGPWELSPNVDCWAAQVAVPNNPVFVGTEWAAQAAFLSMASGYVHFGTSKYTRIL